MLLEKCSWPTHSCRAEMLWLSRYTHLFAASFPTIHQKLSNGCNGLSIAMLPCCPIQVPPGIKLGSTQNPLCGHTCTSNSKYAVQKMCGAPFIALFCDGWECKSLPSQEAVACSLSLTKNRPIEQMWTYFAARSDRCLFLNPSHPSKSVLSSPS